MKLIIGLGNPGERYAKTRHNLGFMIIEHFLQDFETATNTIWENSPKFKSDIAQIEWQRRPSRSSSSQASFEKVILVKPKTYMNNSGMAASLISSFYKVLPQDVWIIHDDIDLPLGSLKIRFGGAAAGHHGVESVISSLGTDKFWRFRLGTGEGHQQKEIKNKRLKPVDDFVLSDFSGSEKGKLKELIKRGVKALRASLENGLESARNRFNTK